MSDIRVSFLDALAEYDPTFDSQKILKLFVIFWCLVSIISSVVLIGYSDGWNKKSFQSNPGTNDFFYRKNFDILYITVGQSFLLPFIAYCAILFSTESTPPKDTKNKKKAIICDCFKCFYKSDFKFSSLSSRSRSNSGSFDSHEDNDGGQPLLAQQDSGEDSFANVVANGSEEEDEGFEFSNSIKRANNKSGDTDYLSSRKLLEEKKSLWLAVLFIVSTSIQIYVGLKCISFNYKNESQQGSLMGLEILWTNLITWSLRELIQKGTREQGELIPNLHPHRLHLHLSLASHWCDMCGQQCKDGKAYRCKLCDFDLCIICYAKRDKFTLEGQLRGDKGIRRDEQITGDKYFMRAVSLVRTEWKIFSLGLLCLLLYNSVSLAMPMIQGSILNSVVNDSHDKFSFWVKLYLYTAIALGLLGGVQSLSFNIVGRKLSNTVRTKLFKGIISQDIAFFDGNSSGQLTSRLTNDVSFMISPIQTMMSTLLSNVFLLVGGIALCFYTSWRLSILAFTTIGPIIHVTQVYATWSQWLNRRIYAALGAANGYATEALGNIRTVKSFSTEEYEQKKYADANQSALDKGIQDAFGGAGMYAINSYLELGSAVLILWYGGLMAMEDKDDMTPGRLITYQLYWNMLNSAYKNLLDIVTSFTRAAGAAQRVFGLMDSLPDINIDSGRAVTANSLKGSIEFINVGFCYQMRPNAKVLDGININIPAGTTCALVGKSGGGKSTLVNLVMRFYDSQVGDILIDGQNLKDLCLRDFRRQIGIVQQNTELFGGTIEENITYGLEDSSWTRQDVIAASKKACAHDFIKDFPEGYLTRVGERGVRISGGQKQRIAIARVFLRNPKILLLDEATSALDAESEAKVQEALDTLMLDSTKKRTIILVAHRLSTVMNADQIAVVNNGVISELGNHETLLNKRGDYYRLVQRQLKKKNSTVDADAVDSAVNGDNNQKGVKASTDKLLLLGDFDAVVDDVDSNEAVATNTADI